MNSNPDAGPSRWIISAGDLTQEELQRCYPEIYQRLHDTTRLQRQSSSERRLRERWWAFSRPANDLRRALLSAEAPLVLASSRVSKYLVFVPQSASTVFSDSLTVFVWDLQGFALLQSRVHEVWAHFFSSSFEERPRYIPELCFEAFPLPLVVDNNLDYLGQQYLALRQAVLDDCGDGITNLYNRFHDPDEASPDIIKLRGLHESIDRAVLDAYGWTNIPTDCQFLLDYEEDEDEEEAGHKRKRRKPWRYRWPDEVRDEVLARLLDLNAKRAEEERLSGAAAEAAKKKSNMEKSRKSRRRKSKDVAGQMELGD